MREISRNFVSILTSWRSTESDRPHRCCHLANNFGSRLIFPTLLNGPGRAPPQKCPQFPRVDSDAPPNQKALCLSGSLSRVCSIIDNIITMCSVETGYFDWPWVHASPQHKRHLDCFSHSSTARGWDQQTDRQTGGRSVAIGQCAVCACDAAAQWAGRTSVNSRRKYSNIWPNKIRVYKSR